MVPIFIDESSYKLNFTKKRGLIDKNFNGIRKGSCNGKNKTLICAVSALNVELAVVMDNYMKKRAFIVFIHLLMKCITERYNHNRFVLIMDNLKSHHCNEIKQLTKAVSLLYLPKYTPQFNMIEYLFCNHKQLVKRLLTQDVVKDDYDSLILKCVRMISNKCFVSAEISMLNQLIDVLKIYMSKQIVNRLEK